MARPLRLDFFGATHHVTARSNGRKPHLFRNDRDRRRFLELVGQAVRRYGWLVTSWVLMSNHFHLVMETPEPTLSAGMQWLLVRRTRSGSIRGTGARGISLAITFTAS